MTDLPDWSQSSSGDARLVASNGGLTTPLNVTVPLQATDQELVFLTNAAQTGNSTVTVTGNDSGLTYFNTSLTPAELKGPLPVAVSGAIDRSVQVSANLGPTAYAYWILASSDQYWGVSQSNPALVRNPTGVSLLASPVVQASFGSNVVTLNNSGAELVPPAPNGQTPVIDLISFTGCSATGTFTLRVNGAAGQVAVNQEIGAGPSNQLPIRGPLYGYPQYDFWASWNNASALEVTVAYHLEAHGS